MASGIQSNTFYWALTGIFAALHLVMTMIPLFVLTAGSGFISVGLATAIVIGFILGPFYGTLSVLTGSVLGVMIFDIGGILGPIVPVVASVSGALVAGSLKTNQPKIALCVFVVGVAAFLLSPIGLLATIYIWMQVIALALVFLFIYPRTRDTISNRIQSIGTDSEASLLPILLLSFIALLSDSLIGGATAAYWFVYTGILAPVDLAPIYMGTAIIYPLERIAVTIVVTGILLALGRALSGTQLSLLLENTPKSMSFEELHPNEAS